MPSLMSVGSPLANCTRRSSRLYLLDGHVAVRINAAI